MGQTSKPLHILINPTLMEHPSIQALRDKGHRVEPLYIEADLLLDERAWYMTEKHLQYLEWALKGARERKYGKSRR